VKFLKNLILITIVLTLTITAFACENEAEKYYNQAVEFKAQGKDFEALLSLEKTIGIEPNNVEFYTKRASLFYNLGDWEHAIADYDKAISFKPGAALYTARARAYYNMLEHERAIEDFNEAIRIDPLLAEAYVWRGKSYHALGQYELFYEARSYHALSTDALDRYKLALEDITEAIRLDPDADYQAARALVYIDMEQYEKLSPIMMKPSA